MKLEQYTEGHRVSIRPEGVCIIERTSFRGIVDYAVYHFSGGATRVAISEKPIDLGSVALKIDEESRRIEISGAVNNFLIGFLNQC